MTNLEILQEYASDYTKLIGKKIQIKLENISGETTGFLLAKDKYTLTSTEMFFSSITGLTVGENTIRLHFQSPIDTGYHSSLIPSVSFYQDQREKKIKGVSYQTLYTIIEIKD